MSDIKPRYSSRKEHSKYVNQNNNFNDDFLLERKTEEDEEKGNS